MKARRLDLAIISDCHLGTRHCRSAALAAYLENIDPDILIINGDLCDLGPYMTSHWPQEHLGIVQRLLQLASKREVIYVVGNHDAPVTACASLLPGVQVVQEWKYTYHGQRIVCTHGHRFDHLLCSSPFVRCVGGRIYEALQWIEGQIARPLQALGFAQPRVVSALKALLPGARTVTERFVRAALRHAVEEDVDIICCGHIHCPDDRRVAGSEGMLRYLNSGDWVEHHTAIEASSGVVQLVHSAALPASPLQQALPSAA